MERTALTYLSSWLQYPDRKPLVIRGARQVGKTWLVRRLAEIAGKKLIELNFEKQPSQASLFDSNDTKQILLNLNTRFNQAINPERCLLFLDEIQAAPQLFSKLRWFAEDLPQLPVIAAGSLLEFVLDQHAFSMPVGRITYVHLEPLSFEEFLMANNQQMLVDYLFNYDLQITIPAVIHEQLLTLFKEYILIGGLPAAVANWIKNHTFKDIDQIQNDLISTYRDDFAKYKGRIDIEKLDATLFSIPNMLSQKFVFSRVNKQFQANTIKHILNLFEKARLSHKVHSTAANGIPLAAQIKDNYFKEIFLDVGLCSSMLGLNLNQIRHANEINLINNGAIAEQVVGQLLRTLTPYYIEPHLYCWHREESGSNAEIDYLIQHHHQIIPIEVKAGSTGSLKSLHLFMELKKLSTAIRINADYPSKTAVSIKNVQNQPIQYQLISIPFYLIGQIPRLLDAQAEK